jgi:antitoxin (DNA-binding transcriptional repressor) of toxin-antitoxin stability system
MQVVDVNQATQHLTELIDLTLGGDEIFITKDGQTVVKLVPVKKAKKQRQFGSAKGLIKIADDFDEPLEDFKEYM